MPTSSSEPSPLEYRWDDVRVVLALSRHGTLTGAAAELHVNPSTIARRLEALEAAIGEVLFDRTPEGVNATAAAERLLPHAEALEHMASRFALAVDGLEREPRGVVRVTAPPGVAELMIAPRLAALRAAHPEITIELDASIGYADLTRREADIALRARRPTAGDLVTVKLGEAPPAIVAAPELACELGTLKDPADTQWLTWGPDLANIPSARWVAEHVPAECVALRSSSIGTLFGAARTGLGVLLMPTAFAESGRLTEVALGRKLKRSVAAAASEELWLVGHRALRHVPRVAAVWDFLVASAVPAPMRAAGGRRQHR